MIRKLLLIGAAAAIPLGGLAVGAIGGGVAGAGAPVTCTMSSTVTFAPPGLDYAGYATANKTSSTTTSTGTLAGGGCTGSVPALSIASKNGKCVKDPHPPTPACTKTLKYYYGSVGGFASTGASSILKTLKAFHFTINSVAYVGKATSSKSSSTCPGEVGFTVGGTLKTGGYTHFSLNACLGTDTGNNLASGGASFSIDLGDASAGGPDQIQTANIDPATSTLGIS